MWQRRLAQLEIDLGTLGYPQRVVAGLGHLAKQAAHLPGRLQVVLLALELEPLRVVDGGPGLHAQQGVVGNRVLAPAVVAVVGGEQRGADGAGDLDESRVGAVLGGDAVVLDLDEEVLLAEDVLQAPGKARGQVEVLGQERLGDDAAETSGRGDEAVVVVLEQLPVDAGLVVGEHRQVVIELLAPFPLASRVVDAASADRPLEAGLRSHVGLGADDGRYPALVALLVEIEDAVHVAVVGDREGRLAVLDGGLYEIFDPGGPVEHRVLGVGVQVHERRATAFCALASYDHCSPTPCPQASSTACGRTTSLSLALTHVSARGVPREGPGGPARAP